MTTAQIHIKRGTIALLLLVLVSAVSTAMALTDASSIEFTLTATPTTLKAPGPVTVKVVVHNKGTEDITVPMTLYDPDGKVVTAAFDGGVLSQLKAGESSEWEGPFTVTQQHLDTGRLTYNLRLNTTDASGAIAQVSLAATANITFDGDKVGLEVTRTITPEVVRPNSTVTVTYELKNTGTVRLSDIKVRENRLISTTQQNADPLEPGQSATVRFTKQAGNTALESSAVVLYKRAGANTQLRETVDTVAIPIAKPGFSSELTADKTSVTIGEKVVLTLTLTNNGNINYSDVDVTDPKLGDMWTDLVLPAGQTLTQTKEVTMMTPTTFKFNIALSDNTGTKQNETTNELKISAYAEGQQMKLNVQVTPDRTSVDTLPGLVRFSILITNDSNATAKPVNVYHGNLRVAEMGELAPGQSVTVVREFNLSQAGRYRFSVRTVDPLDNVVTFEAEDVNISYSPPTAAPTQEVVPTVAPIVTLSPIPAGGDNSAIDKGRNVLFILVVGLGVLLGASLLLFAASSLMRARARSQSDSAYDHLETAPKRDFADPSTYQGEDAPTVTPAAADSELPPVPSAPVEELPHQKYLKDDAPKTEPEAAVPADEETEGYRLVRDDAETAEPVERGKRRAAKHHKLPEDE